MPCFGLLHALLALSRLNGLVTTPTVSAPISLATSAMTGAAPVPVPPPRPAATKTMSAPCSSSASPLAVFHGRLASDFRIGAGAETLGQLGRRAAFSPAPLLRLERLGIGVGDDEFDALDIGG